MADWNNDSDGLAAPRPGRFATTQWSLVVAAGESDSPDSRAALDELCKAYWYPLYAFLRRQGCNTDEAHDTVQGFLARLIEKRDLAAVRRERGRFRSFLLASIKHYFYNERAKANAQKRGGGRAIISMDVSADAEDRYLLEPVDDMTAERVFERRWALTLLESVLSTLRETYVEGGKEQLFESLKGFLTVDGADETYAEIATRLGMTENAVKVAVHRLRQRYAAALRDEVGRTIDASGDVDSEIAELFQALGASRHAPGG